jgi:chromosome segregation ATPase
MMTNGLPRRLRIAVACAGSLFALGACENEAKIKEIQKKADERVAEVQKDAKEKIAAAEKKVDDAKAEFAAAAEKAKAEADNAIAVAKETADEGAKEAADALAKAREAYKAEARSKLKSLNQDVQEVSVRASRAPAKIKPTIDKAMHAIVEKQKDIAKDMAAFDTATLDTFRAVKGKLDADLALLKRDVLGVKSKLPP